MITFRILGAVMSLILGLALCVPGGVVTWYLIIPELFPNSGPAHNDYILSLNIGAFTFSGWQMWGTAVGLGVVGLLCLLLGFYLISVKDS